MTNQVGLIQNYKELTASGSEIRKVALDVINSGLEAINTDRNIQKRIKYAAGSFFVDSLAVPLNGIRRLFIVGVGKCSMEAVLSLEKILGDRITDGIVVDLTCSIEPKRTKFCKADHPLPTEANIDATSKIVAMLKNLNEDDFVIFVISGGGSTMLCQPNNFTCQDESSLIGCLFSAGANIYGINTVRKHLSLARGGYLAKYAYPARSLSLIFSDIVGNDLSFVASGPTIKDVTTINDAKEILNMYKTKISCNFNVDNLVETPKEDKYFENVTNILFVSNKIALEAMVLKGRELGFMPQVRTDSLMGEAREVGVLVSNEIAQAQSKALYIYGGETTVTVKKDGKGGRNQELVLAALPSLERGVVLAAVNTDGWDNTDVAGAIGDLQTLGKAKDCGLDLKGALEDNRSYNFFSCVGDHIITGLTGSNIADLIVAIKE